MFFRTKLYPEIYNTDVLAVTTEYGIEYVHASDVEEPQTLEVDEDLWEALEGLIKGRDIKGVQFLRDTWCARLSSADYTHHTELTVHHTYRAAEDHLADLLNQQESKAS